MVNGPVLIAVSLGFIGCFCSLDRAEWFYSIFKDCTENYERFSRLLKEKSVLNGWRSTGMKVKNGPTDKAVEVIDCTGLIDEPDMTIYEITIKYLFYQPPKQEVIDYIELSAEDVVLMFNQFKTGGFLPSNCRIILNTALKKEFLSIEGKKDE